MKTNIFKFYSTLFCSLSSFLIFADPGDESQDGELESGELTPINSQLILLIIASVSFAIYTFRTNRKQEEA